MNCNGRKANLAGPPLNPADPSDSPWDDGTTSFLRRRLANLCLARDAAAQMRPNLFPFAPSSPDGVKNFEKVCGKSQTYSPNAKPKNLHEKTTIKTPLKPGWHNESKKSM